MATIFALSSGRGAAGVAVIRVSGPEAGGAVKHMTRKGLPRARQAVLRRLINPKTGENLDRGVVLWCPGPGSFTGEDSAEFHVHGGRAVVAGILEALGELPGLRPARPGEFTRRAVVNGKLDLTAAEGIADLVAAETEAQRRQALRQAGGELAGLYGAWREVLLALRAEVEALIDFPEDDLPEGLEDRLNGRIGRLRQEIAAHLGRGILGERVREGFHVAILGRPNVGKSSLINCLAKRDVAIVTDEPGTTRDVLEVHLDLGGVPVVVSDTAGIRATKDVVEIQGVQRALARADTADFRLVLIDSLAWPSIPKDLEEIVRERTQLVVSRIDLRPEISRVTGEAIGISALTGQGIEDLVNTIGSAAVAGLASSGEAMPTRQRHRIELAHCVEALERAEKGAEPEIRAEELRVAGDALGRITGAVHVEDVLDRIFREFCIGK